MPLEALSWRTEKRRVEELIPWEGNPRTISEKQAEQLEASLNRFGLADIPVLDADNRLIGGHQRCAIFMARGRGAEEIDVRVPSRKLTEEEFEELNVRLNKNMGEWDFDLLANFTEDTLLSIGFDEEELIVGFGLSRAEDSVTDPDRYCVLTVEPPESPRLKLRLSFYCDSIEEFREIKRIMGEKPEDEQDNGLDKERFLTMIRRMVSAV